jgi:t-SNARE complex subunit (syntaxin)
MDYSLVIYLLVGVLGGGLSLIFEYLGFRAKGIQKETTEDRVKKLSQSLQEAVTLISEIESEIKERTTLAEKLQLDIKTYDRLVQLKKPEVEAISQLLRGELQKEGRKSFWQGFAINFLFFVLGAVTSVITSTLLK